MEKFVGSLSRSDGMDLTTFNWLGLDGSRVLTHLPPTRMCAQVCSSTTRNRELCRYDGNASMQDCKSGVHRYGTHLLA